MSITTTTAPSLAREFQDHGVVQLRGLLSPEEAARSATSSWSRSSAIARSGTTTISPPTTSSRGIRGSSIRTAAPSLPSAASHDGGCSIRASSAPVTEMVGPVYAAQSMFYFKPPTARGQALHQDNIFLQAHPETCIAAWIAIDDCDGENGGLKIVPGSHRYEIVCPDEADPEESFTSTEITLPEGFSTVQTELAAGDVLFFHGSMVHGSGPNRSADRFRRSLIFHYVPVDSVEIARFYNPLLRPDGSEVTIAESADGGACGDGWAPAAPH